MNIEKYKIDKNAAIKEAMEKIEDNLVRCIIIVDKNKIIGTLSDGDIRKYLINGGVLSTKVINIMNTNFIFAYNGNKLSENIDIVMKKNNLLLLPIVDKKMNLINVYVRSEK